MKKIEATIQINKVDVVANAISDIVDGFTILEGNGRGSGKRQIAVSYTHLTLPTILLV